MPTILPENEGQYQTEKRNFRNSTANVCCISCEQFRIFICPATRKHTKDNTDTHAHICRHSERGGPQQQPLDKIIFFNLITKTDNRQHCSALTSSIFTFFSVRMMNKFKKVKQPDVPRLCRVATPSEFVGTLPIFSLISHLSRFRTNVPAFKLA